MPTNFVKQHFVSQAATSKGGYVEAGYGQVEPNHLSAQRTSQVYAQLPANSKINVLEQGQFVKYDYAAANGGEVNFTGKGEWMLVYNEIKLYRDDQEDCEFAMIKDNYNGRVYSPYDWESPEKDIKMRNYDGVADEAAMGNETYTGLGIEKVTKSTDPYEFDATEDPLHILGNYVPRHMPEGTTMVPRVFKTNVGDIFTTNMIKETELALGDELTPGSDGILAKAGVEGADMVWQVVRVYTMPDGQKGVKVMRIK